MRILHLYVTPRAWSRHLTPVFVALVLGRLADRDSFRGSFALEGWDLLLWQSNTLITTQRQPASSFPDLATATASFSAKLANSGKRLPTPTDQMPHQTNDLLARIYQSASQTKRQESSAGLRRNSSYPEVLMDMSKLARNSAFHQPSRQNMGIHGLDLNIRGDVGSARLRLHEMQNAGLLTRQHSNSGTLATDAYNNNPLMSESMKYERSSPRSDKVPDVEVELKNQHEVAVLTQSVLKQFGITEDQLSRLTPQEQHSVVQVIQRRYIEMQAQKQMMKMKSSPNPIHGMKFMDAKNDMTGKPAKHEDPQSNPALLKSFNAIPPNSLALKFAPQPAGIPGVTAPGPIPGMLPANNSQIHPYPLRVAQPMPFIQPMGRAPVVPTFLPPQPHIPGRILPSNVPMASPIANQAAALMQMQLLQQQQHQQQQQRLYAAAIQQQQHLQALAAARQSEC